jgi:hypothetical protein
LNQGDYITMRKLTILGMVIALLVTVSAVSAAVKPPPGEHFTFNAVTEGGAFSDTFDGGLSQWTNVSGTGAIVDDGGNNVYRRTGGSYVGAVVGVAGSSAWTDYEFEFDVRKVSGSYFNVVFRYVDQLNYYLLEPSYDQIHIALFKKVNGAFTELTSPRPEQPTIPGTWYHYLIVVEGSSIKVYVDGTLMFDVTDTALSAGKIGVGAYTGSTADYDNILVSGPNISVPGQNEILVPKFGSGWLGCVEGTPFQILDNDMTDDGQAWVQLPAGVYDTYDQARGKPGGFLVYGDKHIRASGKPEWVLHADNLNWNNWGGVGWGNWLFTNEGVTCYSYRFYALPLP